jgi:hypothetical protein
MNSLVGVAIPNFEIGEFVRHAQCGNALITMTARTTAALSCKKRSNSFTQLFRQARSPPPEAAGCAST